MNYTKSAFIMDKNFWLQQWEQREKEIQNSVNRNFIRPRRWDKVAQDYGSRLKSTQKDSLREEIFPLLKEKAILREGMKILDLGCGTGRFAIPFAQMGAKVTAVDVSTGMLKQLEGQISPKLAASITPLHIDWHKADIDQLGLKAAFDLSFAHLTPAVTGPDTFLKFHSTSKTWCVFIAWSGERKQNTVDAVWRHLTGKEMERSITDIIYAFNLLYSSGYRPFIDFQNRRYERYTDPEKEADLLLDLFEEYVEGTKEEIGQKILTYLRGMAERGKINKILTGCVGRMIWKV